MKCKKCGSNILDIVEKVMAIFPPIGHNERLFASVFTARCPKCRAESSRYPTEEEANEKGVPEVFE